MQNKTQLFNDGIATIYELKITSAPGDLIKEELVAKVTDLRYSEEKVGITRFYGAMQSKVKVDRMLRMPIMESVTTYDILKPTDSNQYKIVQVQYPKDIYPRVMDLSLERIEVPYAIK